MAQPRILETQVTPPPGAPLQKLLFKQTVNRDLQKARRLSIQGPFLCMTNVQLESCHSIFYNWKVSDLLVKFAIKARLSLFPTNFTKHVWNREHDPSCPFCHQHTESVAHLMNGCREFHNFYSRRHNRIADKIFEVISGSLSGFQLQSLGWDVDLKVLCFGSLGCIKTDVWTVMRSMSVDKLIVKNTLQWCSLSNLIMANYIWRHRVRKLFV